MFLNILRQYGRRDGRRDVRTDGQTDRRTEDGRDGRDGRTEEDDDDDGRAGRTDGHGTGLHTPLNPKIEVYFRHKTIIDAYLSQ